MIEKDMEDLLWCYPESLLGEKLTRDQRQARLETGISDLQFKDELGNMIVIEVKHGQLQRDAILQVVAYFTALKRQSPGEPIEMMLIANEIPEERRKMAERQGISCKEIPERSFRIVAEKHGYHFMSEEQISADPRCPVQHGQVIVCHYPPCRGIVEGDWDAVVDRVGRNQMEVIFYFPSEEPQHRTLERDSAGAWFDITDKREGIICPVDKIRWLPEETHLKEVQQRLDRLGVDHWEEQPEGTN